MESQDVTSADPIGRDCGVERILAAAEVALVSVRRSRLTQLAEQGSVSARAALGLLANPGRFAQRGRRWAWTLASLGLGWAGEGTLYNILVAALHPVITPRTAAWLHGVGIRGRIPDHQLRPRRDRRSGAEEPRARQGGPAGVAGRPALLVFLRIPRRSYS